MAHPTPAPWKFCPDTDDMPGHRERAHVEIGAGKWVNVGAVGNDADARLIAAAPTMHDYVAKKAAEGCSEAARILEAVNANS